MSLRRRSFDETEVKLPERIKKKNKKENRTTQLPARSLPQPRLASVFFVFFFLWLCALFPLFLPCGFLLSLFLLLFLNELFFEPIRDMSIS